VKSLAITDSSLANHSESLGVNCRGCFMLNERFFDGANSRLLTSTFASTAAASSAFIRRCQWRLVALKVEKRITVASRQVMTEKSAFYFSDCPSWFSATMPSYSITVLRRRRRSKVHSSLIFVLFVSHRVIIHSLRIEYRGQKIIMIIITPRQFLCSCHDDQSRFESSPRSFDECRLGAR